MRGTWLVRNLLLVLLVELCRKVGMGELSGLRLRVRLIVLRLELLPLMFAVRRRWKRWDWGWVGEYVRWWRG